MADKRPGCDVLVLGGGNAALCAALTAREQRADVLVLECAPPEFRGGNSRHTRNLRVMSGAYPEDEYYTDLLRVTGGETDEALARTTIRQSAECREWMRSYGVRFQPPLGGTLHLDRTNAFFLGGGKALMNTWYRAAEKRGVRVLYNADVVELAGTGAIVEVRGDRVEIRARAVIAAAGGFEANLAWLKEAWGEAAERFIVRGTPYNKGRVLKLLLGAGAEAVGDPKQCHAVAVDARAPKFDGGIVTRLDCISLGIVVNRECERFYDEGEDLWPKRYAIWGRLVAQQPDQLAYSITDKKAAGLFMPSVFPPLEAPSIEELARLMDLDAAKLAATVARYNDAVAPGGRFDHSQLDGCRTRGLSPEKTNWARPIDTPPFIGYPLRPGITFTYLGVKVGANARVAGREGTFAAGEIMAGNILGKGYLAGFGMTIGTVFGRIAGRAERRNMLPADEGARIFRICNACRYCEGFCAVYPAMERRTAFPPEELHFLANLCHNCGECFYACQYAPPHEFAVNVPQLLAQIRLETYEQCAWPGWFARAYQRNGMVTALLVAGCGAAMLIAAPRNFYAATGFFVGAGALVVITLAAGAVRFWRIAGAPRRVPAQSVVRGLKDAFSLRYLASQQILSRRLFHHLTFYGFLLCFASTTVAALYHHLFHWDAPYRVLSAPVMLGTVGGAGLLVGTAGLLILKLRRDAALQDEAQTGMDLGFIGLLFLTSLTGLLLLLQRKTQMMPAILAIHLGSVLALF